VMLDPTMYASTPFRNPTALLDLGGSLFLYHAVLAETISRTTGVSVKLLPIGAPNGGNKDWLDTLPQRSALSRRLTSRILTSGRPTNGQVSHFCSGMIWSAFVSRPG
jgi:hypothetical protein